MKYYVLYNPTANMGKGYENACALKEKLNGETEFIDSAKVEDMKAFVSSVSAEDKIVIAGGDGTLNGFANSIYGLEVNNDILYFPTGTGNDFMKDVEEFAENGMVRINEYIRNLPEVEVNGIKRRFINGIGYGIDGYCCEKGDELRAKGKKVNYTSIAIKGMLFDFKPADAKVTVDGVEYNYKKVWICPTMNGRYYGGGMNVSPAQDRLNEERTVTVVLMYGSCKLKTLMVFPKIFKGEHLKHTEMVAVHTGKEITVEFSKPTALQIDGETVSAVSEYTVRSSAILSKETKEQEDELKI